MQIVRTGRYLRDMKRLGANIAEMEAVENAIAADPVAGLVIPGLEGLRKIRFALGHKGKRGGGRAIYYLMVAEDVVIMIFAYSKTQQEDLSSEQRKQALVLLRELRNNE